MSVPIQSDRRNNVRPQLETSCSDEADQISKLKRTACVLCRKRKLKCDGGRPKCQTCSRLGHDCKYDEIRKKSGPKRGYVKALEARLAQVETQLKSTNDVSDSTDNSNRMDIIAEDRNLLPQGAPSAAIGNNQGLQDEVDFSSLAYEFPDLENSADTAQAGQQSDQFSKLMGFDDTFSWELISLGLEEPLPTDDVIADLNELYFSKVHPSLPFLHKAKFMTSMLFAPKARPPLCLRYAMWALAAGTDDRYVPLQDTFYRRARKYQELDELRGFGEVIVTLAHCQSWCLINTFEFKHMQFPRAWQSTGRAVRLAQMLGLYRVDGQTLEMKVCLPPTTDWVELEERRRTFWMCFWGDRCASIGTGWPMSIDEQDILTNLPATEEAYQNGIEESTITLAAALESSIAEISGFAASTLLVAIFGRNLNHLHRPTPNDREHELSGAFWERHRKIDSTLSSINLSLAMNLRIPFGLPDPNVVFLNMCIHTAVICLHQAAIYKADKHKMAQYISQESKLRCLTAAGEIASIMRSVAHLDLSTMNPFMAFCLYVSARVFVQYLKARRHDQHIQTSLDFVIRAMHVMKQSNGLTESFIAQLDLDMEIGGISNPNYAGSLDQMIKKGVPVFGREGKGSCEPNYSMTLTTDRTKEAEASVSNGPGLPVKSNSDGQPPPPQQLRTAPEWQEGRPFPSVGIFDPPEPLSATQTRDSPRTVSDAGTDQQFSPVLFDSDSGPRKSSRPSQVHSWSSGSASNSREHLQPPQHQQQQQQQQQQRRNPSSFSSISPNPFLCGSSGNTTSNPSPGNSSQTNFTPPASTNNDTTYDLSTMAGQLFPGTPMAIDGMRQGQRLDGWDWNSMAGMTPETMGQEEWNRILDTMTQAGSQWNSAVGGAGTG